MNTPTINLNAEQAAAVRAPVGPILVRAGAGSGKTRVLTLRIGHLIEQERVKPSAILAVTFTNKAANELRARLHAQMGGRSRGVVAGTFHSLGLRILRESIQGRLRPYLSSFTVFGPDEQLQLAAEAMDSFTGRPPVAIDPADVLRRVSRLKSRLVTPEIAMRTAADEDEQYTATLYRAYQRKLAKQNGIDFDDCIVLPLRLFNEHPDVLETYQDRWRHVLVDEYQDTDRAQYAMLESLSRRDDGGVRSLFAVGDSQQSIYAFRNADHTIITRFREDFPDALVVDLRTNYRSRQEILDAAYAVIRHASTVEPLLLLANGRAKLPDAAIGIHGTPDARTEADQIAAQAARLIARGRRPSEIAVLFRTGFMSRQFEQAMRGAHVPYKVRGSDGFYDRAVIRDALAYLRAIANPADSMSLTRIANKPARGLGASALEHIAKAGAALGLPLGEAIADRRCHQGLKPQSARAAAVFGAMLLRWRERAASTYPPAHLLTDVLAESGYRRFVEQNMEAAVERGDAEPAAAPTQQGFWAADEPPAPTRKTAPRKPKSERERRDDLDLLDELVTAADEHTALGEFLGEIALLTALPDKDDETRDAVQLLTIHAAKGLEWPIVFVSGLEEGTLPHERALAEPGGVEEERRLCYVAMTRAKEQMLLSWAATRLKGKTHKRSRFLDEVEAYGRERAKG